MEKMRADKTDGVEPFDVGYPRNLLLAVKGQTDLTLPGMITEDIRKGIRYAISTLEPGEQELLRLRYKEAATRDAVGAKLGMEGEQVRQMEIKALRKLRIPSRWNYLQYGIAGYLKKTEADEYRKGFLMGYQEGYDRGAEDVRNGVGERGAADEVLDLPLEALRLSVHAYNCLTRVGYRRIRDVVGLEENSIYMIRRLGEKSAREIAQALQKFGILFTAWNKYL